MMKVELFIGQRPYDRRVIIDGVQQERCVRVEISPMTIGDPVTVTMEFLPDEIVVHGDGGIVTEPVAVTFGAPPK